MGGTARHAGVGRGERALDRVYTPPTKFCVECKHHVVDAAVGGVCGFPNISPITGLAFPVGLPEMEERSYKNARPGGCGPNGDNWEAL